MVLWVLGRVVTQVSHLCKSEIISIITSPTKLISFPNSSITSQYLIYLQRKKHALGTWVTEPGQVAT